MNNILQNFFQTSSIKGIKRFLKSRYFFISTIFIITCLLLSSDYFWSKLPGSHWDLADKDDVIESLTDDITEQSVKHVTVMKGDTFTGILHAQKLPVTDIIKLLALIKKDNISANLKIDQKITFYYNIELTEQLESELVDENMVLDRISIQLDNLKSIEISKIDDHFVSKTMLTPTKKLLSKYEALIESSLISSLKKAGLNMNSIIQLINAYSHQLDLQRQIRSGDKISVIIEKYVTEDGKISHYGRILYAELKSKGTSYKIYSYAQDGKNYKMFNHLGKSIKGTLLQTPVDIVRVSSHFGFRKKHPVLGYGKMHKGVDFAASTGTPIYSSGDGIVEFIGVKNGYGKFILIKHNKELSTAYAHASKFAKNLKKGSKVKQGQVIAYVGSTGYATGPHLHYEVRVNGQQVNPLKFKSTPGVKLVKKDLEKFKAYQVKIAELGIELENKNDVDLGELKL